MTDPVVGVDVALANNRKVSGQYGGCCVLHESIPSSAPYLTAEIG